ncbi:baseplate J/gp47 family protein [Candidatus Daviesbacteria bacterium]|nr:baseplate J/gp47 family protein [Candidatus Daviesbacteria bacterium]
MSFLDKVTAFLPLGKKEEQTEHFFALSIGTEKLTAALWAIEGNQLKILSTASEQYSSTDEIVTASDKLLDAVLGLKEIEPQKILFGVPHSWVTDDNLKDEHLKTLRVLVKELELSPMAYVTTSQALVHFLEKKEGVPTTAVLVGFEKKYLTVTVVRAGKLDGVKVVARGETAGADIEKALLAFTDVETLPSKILIYGEGSRELKSQLLSFSWMSKLSFLHFPKIESLEDDLEIKSVCLAGGSEINEGIVYNNKVVASFAYKDQKIAESEKSENLIEPEEPESTEVSKQEDSDTLTELNTETQEKDDFGFVVGDVAKQDTSESEKSEETEDTETPIHQSVDAPEEKELAVPDESPLEIEDFEEERVAPTERVKGERKFKIPFTKFIPGNFTMMVALIGVVGVFVLTLGAYAFLLKANVKVFVEPKVLERDAQVIADPNQKNIDEEKKVIPGQIVQTEVSGSAKDSATGKKQIGDPAKGAVKVYNATDQQVTLKAGQVLTTDSGIKFKLDKDVPIASKSASAASPPSVSDSVGATAVAIGADGNIPSAVELKVGNYSKSDVVAKSEGNFSGGTSKDVTVVSSEDQQRLLAKLSSDLRKQAQQKLQEKHPDKKILQEALSESIASKSFSKNINDQAGEFSLNLTVRYKGTAFDDADLRTIVSKLVNTDVPEGFLLDLNQTETQADVAKLEKDGKVIFLARFKAKLMPKIDTDTIKNQIKFKTATEVANMLKSMDNILGSEISTTPSLPKILERMPVLGKNITVEVGLK